MSTVVDDEERTMPVARGAERRRGSDQLIVGQALLPELDDVDAAAQRRIEQRPRIAAARTRLEHEIETRTGETGTGVHRRERIHLRLSSCGRSRVRHVPAGTLDA